MRRLSIEERIASLGPSFNRMPRISPTENFIGYIQMPVGVAENFVIDGKECYIPMATEEPSVIAAASYGAKLTSPNGFITKGPDTNTALGQMFFETNLAFLSDDDKVAIIDKANEVYGKERRCKAIDVYVHSPNCVILVADVKDALGANVVNTMCEGVMPFISDLLDAPPLFSIVSNLNERMIYKAKAKWKFDVLGGGK